MADIVERLRLLAAVDNCQASLEAAAEIEQNRIDLEEYRRDVERLINLLNLYRDAVRIDVKMTGPKFLGSNASALKRAWEADMAVFNGEEGLT